MRNITWNGWSGWRWIFILEGLPSIILGVITLFYLEQKAYEEVAAMLGLPLGTVKTALFRAKQELLRIRTRHARGESARRDLPERLPKQSPADPAPGWCRAIRSGMLL